MTQRVRGSTPVSGRLNNLRSVPVKQPWSLRALALSTPLMLLRLHGENLLLLRLSPDVALANMM